MEQDANENQAGGGKARNTFRRTERLKSKKLIDGLFGGMGDSKVIFPYRLIWSITPLPVKASPMQSGFAVPVRLAPKAHMRNRLKRLMREAFRTQKHELYRQLQQKNLQLAVMFVYIGKNKTDFGVMARKMQQCLAFLEKQAMQHGA